MALRRGRTRAAKGTRTAPKVPPRPTIHPLDRREVEALLARNHVGRIAYSFHDRVDIEPIHYVFDEGVLCLRTSPGSKLTTVEHNPWVAFEVDEVDALFEWRSVVAHGTLYLVEDGAEAIAHATYQRTLERLRTLIPETFAAGDPVPYRHGLYRLHLTEATGRVATTGRRAKRS